MATTALDVINRSLRRVGVLASGETADANDANEALDILNDLLEQWTLEDLMITNSIVTTAALTANLINYTIGPTGTIVVPDSPVEILGAYVRDSNNIDTALDIVSFEQYQKITLKQATGGSYPTIIGYQSSHPNAGIYLWPAPIAGLTLRLVYNTVFTSFASLSSSVDMSSGYRKALVDCLAQELCVVYGRPEMMDAITQIATMSKMNIKRKNVKSTQMSIDAAFITGKSRAYNPYSDN